MKKYRQIKDMRQKWYLTDLVVFSCIKFSGGRWWGAREGGGGGGGEGQVNVVLCLLACICSDLRLIQLKGRLEGNLIMNIW